MARRLSAIALTLLVSLLAACAQPLAAGDNLAQRVAALLPTDALLLGEQHDNPDHQRVHHDVIHLLATRGQLAAVVLEMAEQGASTAQLPANSTEQAVQVALRWDDKAWPWDRYAATVMRAVRSGVVVYGANMPRRDMRNAMGNASLDQRLDAAAMVVQRDAIRDGHCNLLPESQIAPMTRIQIARDVAMAQTLAQAALSAPGKITVMLAGSAHVDKTLGIPRHLAAGLSSRSVLLFEQPQGQAAAAGGSTGPGTAFDSVWPTRTIEPKDYCAEFKASRGG